MGVTEVEETAYGAGMMRALEQHAARPLFEDPYAERFLSGWAAVVTRHRVLRAVFLGLLGRAWPGAQGAVACRTRAIDDACREALAGGVARVVLVGAGMDARAYRLAEMRTAEVWEFDLPGVQAVKKAAVARVLGELPAHVTYVPVDLVCERVGAGGRAALVVCEAVSMYLPREAVEQVVEYAGSLPGGSWFVVTYMTRAVAEDPRHAKWGRRLPVRSSFEPGEVAELLAKHGLRVVEDVGADDYQERYLRPYGRQLRVFEGERVVVARRH